eukprot:gene18901-6263_t
MAEWKPWGADDSFPGDGDMLGGTGGDDGNAEENTTAKLQDRDAVLFLIDCQKSMFE